MTYVALISIIMLIQFQYFGIKVGQARGRTGIKAPAMSGDDSFERTVRVHLNTAEQLLAALPIMWICAHYFRPDVAAALGLVFVIGRALYSVGYNKEAGNRTAGMMMGFLAVTVMTLLSLYAIVMKMI